MKGIDIRGILLPTIAFTACALLAGCKAAPLPPADSAGFAQGLDRYYEGRPMCLWPDSVRFPVEDAAPDEIDERGFNALTDAGFLVRNPASSGAAPGSATYDLSPEGRSALNPDVLDHGAGNFCYGRRKVVSIDSARKHSPTTEIVDYHYAVDEPAAWAREYAVQAAFPQVVSELASPHQAEVTLLDTTGGWEVSGTPASIAPTAAGARISVLAKAKKLLLPGSGSSTSYAARSSF
ncbi:MAG: hypothetical protein ABR910_01385 [Acidobacteriaceae bacterium]|jgi:hypothetical protein